MIRLYHIKKIPRALVRILSRDKYYVCDKCRNIHRSDGNEIRLGWYGSVSRECYDDQQRRIAELLFGRSEMQQFYEEASKMLTN